MGTYNPDSPFILGNEWPGIRDYNIELDYNTPAAEYGVGFNLTGSSTLGDARVYSHPFDSVDNALNSQPLNPGAPLQINVYPSGAQYDSGPIRRVVIPVTSGEVTGVGSSQVGNVSAPAIAGGNFSLPGAVPASALAAAVFDGQSVGVSFLTPASSGGTPNFSVSTLFWFGVDQYAQLLQGKRILEINLLFKLQSSIGVDAFSTQNFATMDVYFVAGHTFGNGAAVVRTALGSVYGDNASQMQRYKIGEVTPYWNLGSGTQPEFLPWTPALVQNFSPNAAAANRFGIGLTRRAAGLSTAYAAGINNTYNLYYVALEILFCEETRVAVGGKNPQQVRWPYGAQVMTMRNPSSLAASPVLGAGSYVATVIAPASFDLTLSTITDAYPPLQAMQTYYDLAAHLPVLVQRPFPVVNGVGQQFTSGDPPAVPQITIHDTTGAPLTSSHVYGRRADVPVDTATTPVQVIDTTQVVAGARYDQVRFYARRWGTADQPLTVSVMGASASITAAQLDALNEIVDGYREVTLALSAAVTVTGTGATMQVAWSSPNAVGRRYEILGVSAPALSGVAGLNPETYLATTPATSQLGGLTYLEGRGTTDALSWMTETPPISGTGSDPITDAVVLLSQSSIQVSGVALNQATLALTGAALNCGVLPDAIPSGVVYNVISWNNPGITGSGFGYYELQRMSTVNNVWYTIAKLSTQATLSFRDFEARVGVLTSYRIRVANVMGFAGPWSATVSGTIAAPGVTGTDVASGALIFTSNANQAGVYILAYTEALGTSPTEPVNFPESGRVKLQWMYGRNDMAAFFPTERGGEQFTRGLLVRNAAVTGPAIQQGMQSLRDMGWASLPYVCVRNEIGDRWFANVQVPSGTFQRNRALQIVQVQITEVTDTPSVVTGA